MAHVFITDDTCKNSNVASETQENWSCDTPNYSYSSQTWKHATRSLVLCSENNISLNLVHTSMFSSESCQFRMYTIWIWLIPILIVLRLCSWRQISIKSPHMTSSLQPNGIQSLLNDPWMDRMLHSAVCWYESNSWLNAIASSICPGVPLTCCPSFNGAQIWPWISIAPCGNAVSATR